MPIPEEILSVSRPTNTVVIAYGKNKDRYAVRKRIGCRNVDGRHLPVNGPTIGHIINFEYVPMEDPGTAPVSCSPVELKDWANVVACDNLFRGILDDLCALYDRGDAVKIYCISILRVCYPGLKDCGLKEAYDNSFLSELYPGVALSRNTVSKFLNDLGKVVSRIVQFMRNRAAAVGIDHHLLVDGTLKSDESVVNSLSDFSRKARTKGTRDISVLYAFDLEAMEPVCSMCFPGNMLDLTAYEAFISGNGITKGVIVADKGFPSSAAERQFREHPDLHYLNPIKRNSKLIERHRMMDFSGILKDYEWISFRKEKCSGVDKWLYSFRDGAKASMEEKDWFRRVKKDDEYSLEELRRRQPRFGTIVLESDLDLPPDIVYKTYASRWEIELVMRFYKSACEFDETRVQDDYSVLGSEFCDFLSAVLTFRLIKALDTAKILERMTYRKVMSVLERAKKVKQQGGEWMLVRTSPSHEEILQKLGLLSSPVPALKRKRGRPRKKPV